jgi:hypothetical protein
MSRLGKSTHTKTSAEVVENGPESGLEPQWSPDGSNASHEWDSNDEVDIEPVDVLVPIVEGDGGVCDMGLWLGAWFPHRRSGSSLGAGRAHGEERIRQEVESWRGWTEGQMARENGGGGGGGGGGEGGVGGVGLKNVLSRAEDMKKEESGVLVLKGLSSGLLEAGWELPASQ